MRTHTSSPVLTFAKVLRAYDTGGFTHTDVVAQLEQLLAVGASPAAMLEILRHQELIEPFPEHVHVAVLRLLNAALAREAAEAAAESRYPVAIATQRFDPAGAQAESAEGGEGPSKSAPSFAVIRRQSSSAAASQLVSPEGTRSLYERLTEMEAAAAARVSALAAELAAARSMIELEHGKRRDSERALAESMASNDSARLRNSALVAELATARNAIQSEQSKCRDLNKALAESVARFEALRQEHASMLPELDAQTKAGMQLAAELSAARKEAEAIALQLTASKEAATLLDARLTRSESDLNAARGELGAIKPTLNSHLEIVRSSEWRRGFDHTMLHEMDARLQATDARFRATEARLRATEARHLTLQAERDDLQAQVQRFRAVPDAATRALQTRGLLAGKRQWLNSRSLARLSMVGFAVVVVAVAAWFLVQRTPAPRQALQHAPAATPAPGVIRDCPTCPSMVVVPAGRFEQGSSRAKGGSSFEMPAHWVSIGRPLGMSVNAVTVDQFQQFIAATGRDVQGCDVYDGEWKNRPDSSWRSPGFSQTGAHPVTCVSWDDAKAYASWLSANTGHRYRLPSASEWEYAARSGGEAVLPWSVNGSAACANANVADASAAQRYPGWTVFACNDDYVYTAPVGSFKANAFGLNDMLGNVFQWTEDCWHADYVGAPLDGSARDAGDCSEHELRGGSWFSTPAYVRANYRNHFAADYRTSTVGIRLVRDIES